jgi:threonine 3-dehydrogenase
MAVLITGGYGLIGSTLARILIENGEKVWVFDKFTPSQRFGGSIESIQTVQGDLSNFPKVIEAVKESAPQTIFHLGGMLSLPSNADPQSAYATNVAGTYHVLEAARLFHVPKVIFTSTIATYGIDIQKDVIDDFTLQRPITMYGATKVFGELLGRFYRTKYNLDFRAARFPAIVGPGAKTAHISIYNAWAVEKAFYNEPYEIFVEPQIRCPILYFKDAARSLFLLNTAPPEAIQTICYLVLGIKPMTSAAELETEIRKHFPKASLSYKPDPLAMSFHGKNQGFKFEDEVAQKEWGWNPEYTLGRMIEDFYSELRNNPERYR